MTSLRTFHELNNYVGSVIGLLWDCFLLYVINKAPHKELQKYNITFTQSIITDIILSIMHIIVCPVSCKKCYFSKKISDSNCGARYDYCFSESYSQFWDIFPPNFTSYLAILHNFINLYSADIILFPIQNSLLE